MKVQIPVLLASVLLLAACGSGDADTSVDPAVEDASTVVETPVETPVATPVETPQSALLALEPRLDLAGFREDLANGGPVSEGELVLEDTDADAYVSFRSRSVAVSEGESHAFCAKLRDTDAAGGYPALRLLHAGTGTVATLVINAETGETDLREHVEGLGYTAVNDADNGHCILNLDGLQAGTRIVGQVLPAISVGFPAFNTSATGAVVVEGLSLRIAE